ncbi:hypothetical protein HMPREF0872_03815 [Veillonella montpellierensis DNF00314]|uniref:Uncharacterized protein n=1 Tax=Veillonella montpellierensis DNF00314 TaxID=1401067 RepID=A0A096CQC4_9FIRM|nr:hypothetical protein [Veillonella montpellierensis]KGF47539.1 hypothetical protein HMPREF0872_03815 [Veillonella montpellierensis DNF00314]
MILVKDVIQSILYDKGEMYARKHSNEELINTINLVLNYLNLALINADSDYIVKEKDIKLKNGKALVPEDFVKLKGVESQDYNGKTKVLGHTLYLDSDETISYFYQIPKVLTIEDEIDLPYLFFALLVRYAGGILDGAIQSDTLANALSGEVQRMTQSNTVGPIIRPMQFYV